MSSLHHSSLGSSTVSPSVGVAVCGDALPGLISLVREGEFYLLQCVVWNVVVVRWVCLSLGDVLSVLLVAFTIFCILFWLRLPLVPSPSPSIDSRAVAVALVGVVGSVASPSCT